MQDPVSSHEAMLYEPLDAQQVRCRLCGHECLIAAGRFGACRVRQNIGGKLFSRNFDALVALNVDPIEKKPLFHFLPGSLSLSLAAAGCNFQCAFCQNWQISQAPREGPLPGGQAVPPGQLVELARRQNCASISYTYTEPTIFFELAYETSVLARQAGVRNVFVSNGYMTPLAVRTIAPHLDAINVDLKAFRDQTYRQLMKARLEPVLMCLRELAAQKVWTEVTTLVVPGMNDSDDELGDIAGFIAGQLGREVPWHVSRFHADYRMAQTPSTPLETLQRAMEIGRQAGLKFVYSGNVPGQGGENTFCPVCGKLLVGRHGFGVTENHLRQGRCGHCQGEVPGVW